MPSNRSHWFKEENLVKRSTNPMPEDASYKDLAKMDFSAAMAQERAVTNNPEINPAGKGKFYSAFAPRSKSSEISTYAMPDARHAARLRGLSARKRARSWDTIVQEQKK